MASNYEEICIENRRRYGSEGAQKSGELAAGLYDNATHFIFELLQNTEDALKRRVWSGPRKVSFDLTSSRLRLSHFGKPFDTADVESVCDIAESTKDESSIGRFGLGFKSVYTVTDLPEIHSGEEDFAIENYVFPKQANRTERAADETQIILPLRSADTIAQHDIIKAGLRHLGPGALLFLRQIDEINWSVADGASGFYLRNSPQLLDDNVRRITVIGQESGQPEVDQNWLVFHRDVSPIDEKKGSRVEIAFALEEEKDVPGRWRVKPLASSPLVVFFPTVVETHLGFLAQGPYRTTPSRENIHPGDHWNQHLVKETAALLTIAMRWMRDETMLDVSALRCLPLERQKFPQDSQFSPIFNAARQAFQEDSLLPTFGGNYATAYQAKLARTQELRELFDSAQLAALFGLETAAWLSSDITQDKTPEIRQYLMQELKVDEIRPERLLPNLTKPFLEAQTDEWVLRLYEFLSGQEKALRRYLDTIPLIRLNDGTHVVASENGKSRAFLPSAFATSFPTIRREVCTTHEVRTFLISLGITEPDPVDDVIWNVLPKYQRDEVEVDDETYAADIERIRLAFSTDSTAQKEKLRTALRNTTFVMVVDAEDGTGYVAKPSEIYIATDRLKQLFARVPGVLIVDDEYDCLRGEDTRELLVACGASRYLSPEVISTELGYIQKEQIRKEAGLQRASWESPLEDFTLRGLTELLELLPKLPPEEIKNRTRLLWDSLADLEARGTGVFYGSYKWGFGRETKTARFDASFIQTLNQAEWLVDANGELVSPNLVVFSDLGWEPNPFLLTKLNFKPPIIDQLAREVGIDPAALDLLRKHGITSVTDLASRLGILSKPPEPTSEPNLEPEATEEFSKDVYDGAQDLYGDDMPIIQPGTYDSGGDHGAANSGGREGNGHTGADIRRGESPGHNVANNTSRRQTDGSGQNGRPAEGHGNRSPGRAGSRPFISYVRAHLNDEEPDADGVDQATRMQIEEQAIKLIISLEPALRRTDAGNPGFDLCEINSNAQPIRWVEVKSMTGSLNDRPVGLSHTQFECARVRGSAYWLYVVEYASDPAKARVLRIQNPFGHARTFTFDKGWAEIAQMEPHVSMISENDNELN